MKKLSIFITVFLLFISCSVQQRFVVSKLGYEPPEVVSSEIYILPRSVIKAGIEYEHILFIPGPYALYAQRMLGIEGAEKERSESYSLTNVELMNYTEIDDEHQYSINLLDGELDNNLLLNLEKSGYIHRAPLKDDIQIDLPYKPGQPYRVLYDDVTMESNVELKQQTIYKTIITDTSFVRVPVTSQQMERKTLEKKAEEAAKLILEIRSDRYFLAAGLVDPFPDNFDMNTALEALDRLETEYLSLFIGKTFKEQIRKEYIVDPSGSIGEEVLKLDLFSPSKGLGTEDGSAINLVIRNESNAQSLRNLLPQQPEESGSNRIYYRIPGRCTLSVEFEGEKLHQSRMNIFQAGALVNEKAAESF